MSFFQNFFNFSLNKFLKRPWQDFGAPLRAAPGGRCPPCPPPPRYATGGHISNYDCNFHHFLVTFRIMTAKSLDYLQMFHNE